MMELTYPVLIELRQQGLVDAVTGCLAWFEKFAKEGYVPSTQKEFAEAIGETTSTIFRAFKKLRENPAIAKLDFLRPFAELIGCSKVFAIQPNSSKSTTSVAENPSKTLEKVCHTENSQENKASSSFYGAPLSLIDSENASAKKDSDSEQFVDRASEDTQRSSYYVPEKSPLYPTHSGREVRREIATDKSRNRDREIATSLAYNAHAAKDLDLKANIYTNSKKQDKTCLTPLSNVKDYLQLARDFDESEWLKQVQFCSQKLADYGKSLSLVEYKAIISDFEIHLDRQPALLERLGLLELLTEYGYEELQTALANCGLYHGVKSIKKPVRYITATLENGRKQGGITIPDVKVLGSRLYGREEGYQGFSSPRQEEVGIANWY